VVEMKIVVTHLYVLSYYTVCMCVNRFTGWFLHKLLGRLLSAVIVHRGQMQMLQLACKVREFVST